MKIRSGFVSNSSSSSFIVAVPKDSDVIDKLEDLMEQDYCCENSIDYIRTEKYEEVQRKISDWWIPEYDQEAIVGRIMEAAKCDLEVYEIDLDYNAESAWDHFREKIRPYVIEDMN